ncbi:MAG: hypothetical protein C4538_04750 [Nitrospiraceae bacterium]|nr:MAG: hypothetical protein C4538_04750 [Nitrospiraceae bacterium]
MISIYLDEDVDVLLKPLLAAKGYSVFTPLEEKMLSKSDGEQFEHALNSNAYSSHIIEFITRNYTQSLSLKIKSTSVLLSRQEEMFMNWLGGLPAFSSFIRLIP